MKTLLKLMCIIRYSLEAQQFKYVAFNIWDKNALKIPLLSLTNKDINTNMMNINMHDVRKNSQKENPDHEGRFSS